MRCVVILLVVLLGFGCESWKPGVRQIADEYCKCFQPVQAALSAETLTIYEQSSTEEDLEKVYEELKTTDSARGEKGKKELERFEELLRTADGPTGCLVEMDLRYGVGYLDEVGKIPALVEQLKGRSDCRAAKAFLQKQYEASTGQ